MRRLLVPALLAALLPVACRPAGTPAGADGLSPGGEPVADAAAAPPADGVPITDDLRRALCNATCGGRFAFLTPWLDAAGTPVRYELRGDVQRCSSPPTLFFDPQGNQTGAIPLQPVVPGSEEALRFQAIREGEVGGLREGPSISCDGWTDP